ncbi:uncharacterized protein LOC116296022 [Actinia tenebrosa]|uniref:Uncharacterized protein LOC116296022 n=1 Tax=Actinia tenebrosa TaxID=6105 RepID=A0A6P8I502_ACTTE|nr:uncharacterized protein LOC116296022 [Actinia tenebrosa]
MIRRHIFCAFIVFLTLSSYQSLTESCVIYKFAKQEGLALVNHTIKTISRGLVEVCWSECVGLPECYSINVRQVFGIIFECELNNSTKQASPEDLVSRPGSDYHDMVDVESKYCSLYECARKQVLSDGWFGLGLFSLKLFTENKNWAAASAYCKSLGAELVSIKSSYKDSFIYNVLVKEVLNAVTSNKSSGASQPADYYKALDGHDDDVLLLIDASYKNSEGETALSVPQMSFAKVPAVPFNPEGFTIAFWVKIGPSPGDWENTIFGDVPANDKTFQIKWKLQEEQLVSWHFTPQQTNYATIKSGSGKIPRSKWEHIAITFNRTKVKGKIYLDGKTVSTTLTPNSFKASATTKISPRAHYKIGAKKAVSSTNENPFNGLMRHLMVFNRELSTDEIKIIMKWSEYGPWIGLSDDTSDKKFAWSDGSPIGQYVPLPIYKPNKASKSKLTCVAMKKNGKWINTNCNQERPFVCQKPIT